MVLCSWLRLSHCVLLYGIICRVASFVVNWPSASWLVVRGGSCTAFRHVYCVLHSVVRFCVSFD
jgi:hypothetical protein